MGRSFEDKWSADIEKHGFTDVPNILLQYRKGKELKISAPQFVTLIALLSFKWDERKPMPSMATISKRANCDAGTARKHIAALEQKGVLRRVRRTYQTNEYDITPLIQKLDDMAKVNPTPSQSKRVGTLKIDGGVRSDLTAKEDSLEQDSRIKLNKTAGVSGDTTELKNEVRLVYDHFIKQFDRNSSLYKLTDKRKAKIKSRLKDAGYDMLIQAIDNVAANDWYRGENDHNWKADLDYITRSYEQVERLSQLNDKTVTFKAEW